MLSVFVTLTAWLALIMGVSGVLLLLRPKPEQSPQLLAIQAIISVAVILCAVGLLARSDWSVGLPLSLVSFVLAILAIVFYRRYRRV